MKYLLLFVAAIALAQTVPEVSPIAGKSSVDNSAATEVKPVPNVTSLPGTCAVGDQVFKTNATAGQNLYACTSTNTWTVQTGASAAAIGGTITGATDGSILFAHPSAVFAQDNANFNWQATAHCLNIGLTDSGCAADSISNASLMIARPYAALGIVATGGTNNAEIYLRGMGGTTWVFSSNGNSPGNFAFYDATHAVNALSFESNGPNFQLWGHANGAITVGGLGGTYQDTGFARNAARVMEINDGTPGTFGDLHLRNITIDGTCTGSACTGSGTVTVVGAGSLGSTQIVTGGGTTTIQTPSSAATVDSSGNIKGTSIATGATPPSSSVCTAGTAGFDCLGEGTTPTGTLSGTDVLWANSSTHRLDMINNNATNDAVVGAATTDTFTNKTFDTAGTGNSLKVAGTALTAVSGSGAVCLASGSACASSGLTQIATVTLTSAQIKALGTGGNAITAIVAPGSGNYIQILSVTAEYSYSTAAYTGGGNIGLAFDSDDNYDAMSYSGNLLILANNLASAQSRVWTMYPNYPGNFSSTGGIDPTNSVNKAIFLCNQGTAWATGSGTLKLDITYIVHSGF